MRKVSRANKKSKVKKASILRLFVWNRFKEENISYLIFTSTLNTFRDAYRLLPVQ